MPGTGELFAGGEEELVEAVRIRLRLAGVPVRVSGDGCVAMAGGQYCIVHSLGRRHDAREPLQLRILHTYTYERRLCATAHGARWRAWAVVTS